MWIGNFYINFKQMFSKKFSLLENINTCNLSVKNQLISSGIDPIKHFLSPSFAIIYFFVGNFGDATEFSAENCWRNFFFSYSRPIFSITLKISSVARGYCLFIIFVLCYALILIGDHWNAGKFPKIWFSMKQWASPTTKKQVKVSFTKSCMLFHSCANLL